jgi:signal transduction histidine kinase
LAYKASFAFNRRYFRPHPRNGNMPVTMEPSSSPIHDRTRHSWTDWIPKTEHNNLFLAYDFSTTSLGDKANWDSTLRAYVSMIFADSRGACLYWGPDRIAIYNEAFAVTAEGHHPFLMGHSFAEALPELVGDIEQVFQHAAATGETADVNDIQLFIKRNGYLEETYFLGQFIPLRGESGTVEGFYNTTTETTSKILLQRHRQVLDRVASILPHSTKQTFSEISQALHTNPYDITAALLYSFDELALEGADNLHLECSVGFAEYFSCAPPQANLGTSESGLIPYFRHVHQTGRREVLDLTDGSIPQCTELFAGVNWSGFGEPSKKVIICPLTISGKLLGFYVQGTNPRREYDHSVERCIAEITTQMELKWADSTAREQAKLRAQVSERRAVESEGRLRSLGQNAPLGMYQIGLDRRILWANDQFYDITGHDRSRPEIAQFVEALAADERDSYRKLIDDLMVGGSRVTTDIRLRRTWKPPPLQSPPLEGESGSGPAWILAVTFPLMEDGEVKSVLGYVTDISRQKWAAEVQARSAAAAIEATRRQEEFLDITSHELRNPLSAITQLADNMAKTPSSESNADLNYWRDLAYENREAATTILACAAHLKRVIDDVLVLSRLDSQLLSITRTAARAQDVVTSTMKMFEGLAAQHDIKISAARRGDDRDLEHVELISFDTSRFTQVLINLIGNAIKFTAGQPVREISVVFGLRAQRISQYTTRFGNIAWVDSAGSKKSLSTPIEVEQDERKLYAFLIVEDTGIGLTPDGITRLFQRFAQATSKTQITYGGSGLGLHVCKQLAEKQGGGIGVASEHGRGSAFGFYLETKSVSPAGRPIDGDPVGNDTTLVVGKQLSPHREGFHILLVEDNLINQKVLAKQLRKAKCTVTVANHGVEALEILEQSTCWKGQTTKVSQTEETVARTSVEVILMDIEMPVMNGLICTSEIRKLQKEDVITGDLPIIATTANGRQEQKEQAFNSGVDSVLVKPFTIAELLARIRELVT